jgi:DNA replication protein DnaC
MGFGLGKRATLITSNLPFDEWTKTFGTERLALTFHIHDHGRAQIQTRDQDTLGGP